MGICYQPGKDQCGSKSTSAPFLDTFGYFWQFQFRAVQWFHIVVHAALPCFATWWHEAKEEKRASNDFGSFDSSLQSSSSSCPSKSVSDGMKSPSDIFQNAAMPFGRHFDNQLWGSLPYYCHTLLILLQFSLWFRHGWPGRWPMTCFR